MGRNSISGNSSRGGQARTLRVPLRVGEDYLLRVSTYGPMARWAGNVHWMADARLATDEGVCLGVFSPYQSTLDHVLDGFGGGLVNATPSDGYPAGMDDYSAYVRVCRNAGGSAA